MKFLVLLAASTRLTAAAPQGSVGVAPPSAATPLVRGNSTAPAGCRKLAKDTDWPVDSEWKKVLPEIEPRSKKLAAGVFRPDYNIRAESYKDVQAAVKFAAQNNIRLTVITSGHDFPGRNDAPSGLGLDTSLLQGVHIHEEFIPTAAGAAKPKKAVNTIVPVAGKQAAVTFGVGVTSQKLHNAVHPSKLLTIGAAHGSVAPAGGYVSLYLSPLVDLY